MRRYTIQDNTREFILKSRTVENSIDFVVQKSTHVTICIMFADISDIRYVLIAIQQIYILWNHFYLWGPMFVDCQNLSGSWGCYFVIKGNT